MKVLMVDFWLPGSPYAFLLSKDLQKYCDLTLACRRNTENTEELESCRKILYGRNSNFIANTVKYLVCLIRLHNEIYKDYDLIHLQSFKFTSLEMPIYLKAIKKGKTFVYTVHNVLPHNAKEGDRELFGNLYKSCEQLIVHNERTKKQLISDFNIPEEKISIVPHGVYGNSEHAFKKKSEECVFLLFGMMHKYKGVDVLINAISLIKPETREKCKFILAGEQFHDSNPIDYVAMAKDLGVDKYIQFELRFIEEEELPALFEKADACIFPYKEIYGSGALMMAYTYRKPVIVSNVPAFIEETENGKTGLLFENENARSLATAIEKYVDTDDEQRMTYSEHIKKLATEKYDWNVSAKKTEAAYEQAMQRKLGRKA